MNNTKERKRFITFQGADVVDTLREKGTYKPKPHPRIKDALECYKNTIGYYPVFSVMIDEENIEEVVECLMLASPHEPDYMIIYETDEYEKYDFLEWCDILRGSANRFSDNPKCLFTECGTNGIENVVKIVDLYNYKDGSGYAFINYLYSKNFRRVLSKELGKQVEIIEPELIGRNLFLSFLHFQEQACIEGTNLYSTGSAKRIKELMKTLYKVID